MVLTTLGIGFAAFCAGIVFFGDMKGDRYSRRCKEWLRNNAQMGM